MKPTLFLLAAGMGSRYGGLKQLDGLGPNGETIMDYSIYDAINAGFGKLVFVIRKDFEQDFRDKIISKYEGHIPCELVFQSIDDLPEGFTCPEGRTKPWGTNHAVMMGADVIKEPFAVINCDDFYGRDSFQVMGKFLAALPEGSIKKQIIISSDKPPKDMEILEERFRSRFEWGLIADITLPDYETRMAILHKKEEMDGYDINEEVIKYIANNIKSNIRELEGAINKVMAFAKLEKKEVTLELAEQALKDIISPDEKKVITPDYIISMVAEHFDVTVDDLCGNKRNSKIVTPRQIAMYLCREIISTPLKSIGKCLGNRDHTTIMHGIDKIEKEINNDENLKNTIETLKKKINPQG